MGNGIFYFHLIYAGFGYYFEIVTPDSADKDK